MAVFPNCGFPLAPDSAVVDSLRAAVRTREPFSLIRVGDGEAIVLSLGDETWLQDLAYLHSHWGSEQVSLGAVAEVKRDLETAIRGADFVGVRDDIVDTVVPSDLLDRSGREISDFVRSTFRLRREEVDNLSNVGARRLALLHRVLSSRDWRDGQRFCSAWIHWDLVASGALDGLLSELDEVGVVTSRPEVEHLLARRYGVRTTAVVVPGKFNEFQQSGHHVPQRYRTMRSELRFAPGSVVLVGAGIPGKTYCQWIKESGCIAIDIGAVFDIWVGKASRPRVLESRFGVAGGGSVPRQLQLHSIAGPDDRRVVPRWRPTGATT